MTFFMCLYILSFLIYTFVYLILQSHLLGNNLRNKFNFILKNEIKFIIYLFIFVSILSFLSISDTVTYYLEDETAKTLASVKDNTINIHNPNINLPNSVGKAIASIGIGGTIAAGMTSASTLMKSGTPLGIKVGVTAVSGAVGGGLFVAANYFNTIAQEKAKPKKTSFTSDTFSAKSALDGNENDSSLDAVLGLFNINLMLNICILYLLVAIAILFVSSYVAENKLSLTFIQNIFGIRVHSFVVRLLKLTSKSNVIWMVIAWIILIVATIGSICISYFLLTHLDTISEIYQNSKK